MSNEELTIQVLVREDGDDDAEVVTERKLLYSDRHLVTKRFSSDTEEFWVTNSQILGELDWDLLILSSDQDVLVWLWHDASKGSGNGDQFLLKGGTWVCLGRQIWDQTGVGDPFAAGTAADVVLIEVQENRGATATVRGRFYKQATS